MVTSTFVTCGVSHSMSTQVEEFPPVVLGQEQQEPTAVAGV